MVTTILAVCALITYSVIGAIIASFVVRLSRKSRRFRNTSFIQGRSPIIYIVAFTWPTVIVAIPMMIIMSGVFRLLVGDK